MLSVLGEQGLELELELEDCRLPELFHLRWLPEWPAGHVAEVTVPQAEVAIRPPGLVSVR